MTTAYKLVARLPDGRLVSIHDDTTEYRVGETMSRHGGYYVHLRVLDALEIDEALVGSPRLDNERWLLRLAVSGHIYPDSEKHFCSVITVESAYPPMVWQPVWAAYKAAECKAARKLCRAERKARATCETAECLARAAYRDTMSAASMALDGSFALAEGVPA